MYILLLIIILANYYRSRI